MAVGRLTAEAECMSYGFVFLHGVVSGLWSIGVGAAAAFTLHVLLGAESACGELGCAAAGLGVTFGSLWLCGREFEFRQFLGLFPVASDEERE